MKSIPPSPAMGPGGSAFWKDTRWFLHTLKSEKHQGHWESQCSYKEKEKKKKTGKKNPPHINKQSLPPGSGMETHHISTVTPGIHQAHSERFHLACQHLPFGSCLECCTWKDPWRGRRNVMIYCPFRVQVAASIFMKHLPSTRHTARLLGPNRDRNRCNSRWGLGRES